MVRNPASDKAYLEKRLELARTLGFPELYEFMDHFGLYAGIQTIGNKIFTYELLKQTAGVPGHIAEFGSWKGSNLLFLAKMSRLLEPESVKRVIAFDNFSGLPEGTSEDGKFSETQVGKYKGDEAVLRRCIELFEFEQTIELVKGDACETIPAYFKDHEDLVLSFAYLDFDLYEPTSSALSMIEETISVGGMIVFDEALTEEWPGETIAMKEYLKNTSHGYKMIANDFSRQPTVALKRER